MPDDELISASSEISVQKLISVRYSNTNPIILSSRTYPAVGYWTDYSKDTVIRPSTNAGCWGERDFVEPTPEPEPEPEPTPETPAEEPNE